MKNSNSVYVDGEGNIVIQGIVNSTINVNNLNSLNSFLHQFGDKLNTIIEIIANQPKNQELKKFSQFLEENNSIYKLKKLLDSNDISETERLSVLSEYISVNNSTKLKYVSSFNKLYQLNEIFIEPDFDAQNNNFKYNELLSLSQRLVIHSDSFTGKSTLLKHIALNNPKFIFVFLPLAKYSNSYRKLFISEYNLSNNDVDLLLGNKNVIFLFDAFDEIQTADLQQKFISEINELTNQFILTSRTKALTKFMLPADKVMSITDYSENEIYILVDKILNDTSDVLKFYNTLFAATNVSKNDFALKYPWLVIFLLEYFKEGLFDIELIQILHVEILDGVRKKLLSKNITTNEIDEFYLNIGEYLCQQFYLHRDEVRELDEGSFRANQKGIIDTMVDFGFLNSVSYLQKRKYFITVPLINKILVANYLSELSDEKLSAELSKIYCRSEFKEVIALVGFVRWNKGYNIDILFKVDNYLCNNKQSVSNYEYLLQIIIAKYLPKSYFSDKTPILNDYFNFVVQRLSDKAGDEYFNQMDRISNAEEHFHFDFKDVLEEKMLSFLPFMLLKNNYITDKFVSFLTNKIEPQESYLVRDIKKYYLTSPAYKQNIIEKVRYQKDKSFDIAYDLLLSPYSITEINNIFLNAIEEDIIRSRNLINSLGAASVDKNKYNSSIIRNAEQWHISIALLLINKGNLSKHDVFGLLDLLSMCDFERDYQLYLKEKLGNFKSLALTDLITEYIYIQVKANRPLYYFFPVIHFYNSNLLLEKPTKTTIDNLNNIIEHQTTYLLDCVNNSNIQDWASLNTLVNFFVSIIRMSKLPQIKNKVEKIYAILFDLYKQNENRDYVRRSLSVATIFLINTESKLLLQFFTEKTYLSYLLDEKLFNNPNFSDNLSFSENYIKELNEVLVQNHGENYQSYIEKAYSLIERTESLTAMTEYEKLYTKYVEAQNIAYPKQRYEETSTILKKMCKYERFEYHLKNNQTQEMIPYAVYFGVHNEKPVYIDFDPKTKKTRFNFSCD